MKRFLIFTFLLIGILAVAQKAVFTRDVTVGGKSSKKLTTKLEFYIPTSCSGYRLFEEIKTKTSIKEKEYGVNEYYRLGSLVKIFFSARSDQKLKLVFYKNKVKRLSQEQTSGVLRRVKKFNVPNVKNLEMFKKLWKDNTLEGARFEKKIYSGWNPFGPKKNSLHWYSAFINIAKRGKWTFFSASIDASFLLIDGKLVVNSPYRKWITNGQRGKIKGTVDLKKGIHRLDYLHANHNAGACYAIAAFLPPGAKKRKFRYIPEKLYTPILKATAGALKTSSRRPACDFSWRVIDMIELYERQMYVVKFITPFRKSLSWSLGYKVPDFNYFYFKPGKYTVELKCRKGKIKEDIVVGYQYMLKPIGADKVKKFISEALEQEKQHGIQSEGYAFLASMLIKLKMKKEAEAFYKHLLTKQNSVPPEITFKLFNDLILDYLLRKERYQDAEKQLKRLLKLLKSPELLSTANLAYSELQFYCLGNISEAGKYFTKIKRAKLSTKKLQMRYDLLQADLALMNKGLEDAAKLYKKIKSVSNSAVRNPQLAISGSLIAIQNCYILKKYNDALGHSEKLENVFPEVRLEPSYLLLKAKLLKQLQRPQRAAWILLRLLKTNVPITLATEANWQLAQFYFKNRQYLPARKRLNDILKNAPRSREAAEATKLLKKLKQELQR
jgi:tetratricopeptide (TPR) repeat protein